MRIIKREREKKRALSFCKSVSPTLLYKSVVAPFFFFSSSSTSFKMEGMGWIDQCIFGLQRRTLAGPGSCFDLSRYFST